MARIRILSRETIEHIAAGEVIERPASVVKELIENSIDAGADEISVEIESPAVSYIRVADNGCGMDNEDLRLSVHSHTTSKIQSSKDLASIFTLGFRGEALSSIVSVSKTRISTRTEGSGTGSFIYTEAGDIIETGPAAQPKGTIIEVRDLFFNTPARKKFLKTEATEQRKIVDMVSTYALCYPRIRFSLKVKDRDVLNLAPSEDHIERVASVLGHTLRHRLYYAHAERPSISIKAIMASPDMARATKSHMYTFVNGRHVKDSVLTGAIMEGFRGLLVKKRYPLIVLFVDIDPSEIDVNVHPTKTQVRFRNASAVFGIIASTIKKTLADFPWDRAEVVVTPSEASRTATKVQEPGPLYGQYKQPKTRPSQASLIGATGGFYSSKKVIGVLHSTYILLQDKDALYILDQHASHERINYERLKSTMSSSSPQSQMLLEPRLIELKPDEYAVLKRIMSRISMSGIELEPFGGTTVVVRAVPRMLASADIEPIILDIINLAMKDSTEGEGYLDDMIATIACHRSITAGDKLDEAEIAALLRDLDEVGSPRACPHGRPLYKKIYISEIEKWLARRP